MHCKELNAKIDIAQLDKMCSRNETDCVTRTVCTAEFDVDANTERNVDGGEQALLVLYNVIYDWQVVDFRRVHTFECVLREQYERWTLDWGMQWVGSNCCSSNVEYRCYVNTMPIRISNNMIYIFAQFLVDGIDVAFWYARFEDPIWLYSSYNF